PACGGGRRRAAPAGGGERTAAVSNFGRTPPPGLPRERGRRRRGALPRLVGEDLVAAEARLEGDAGEAVALEQGGEAGARVIELVVGGAEIARPGLAAAADVFAGRRRGEIEHAAGREQARQRLGEGIVVGHVLDHLRAIDAVE